MDEGRLVGLLETVRGVKAAAFQMEQELLSAKTAEQMRRDTADNRPGSAPDEWFTLAELGEWLKISRTSVYRLIRQGHIPSYRIDRAIRIRQRDIEHWLEDEGRNA